MPDATTYCFPLLAEASPSFSFSAFQKGFFDAWDFVFPNALMLLLCIVVVRYVGKLTLPWLQIPWGKVRSLMLAVHKFLEESKLFGSQLIPAIILLAVVIATLNVFQVVRGTAHLLPPDIVYYDVALYRQHASDDVCRRILVMDKSIRAEHELYDYIRKWTDRLEREKESKHSLHSGYDHWDDNFGEWIGYSNDVKMLAAVACISCLLGVIKGRWLSILRLMLILVFLTPSYFYCVAKALYAYEQRNYSVLDSLEDHLRTSVPEDWERQLLERATDFSPEEDWIKKTRQPSTNSWWGFEYFNRSFIERSATLFSDKEAYQRGPLISEWDLQQLRGRYSATATNALQETPPKEKRGERKR